MAIRSPSRSVSSPSDPTPEIKLSPKQREFVLSDSRLLLFRGGIRSGKTVAGTLRTWQRRFLYPGTVQLVGGPSWDQVRDGTMRTMRQLINPDWIVYENANEHRWVLRGGSEIIFRTLVDPDVLRSLEFHDAYIDENAMLAPAMLDIVIGRVSLRYDRDPTFRGSVWCTTTPRGMDYTLDVWGMDGNPELGREVFHHTIFDNRANLPDGYIEQLETKYRDTPFYEQELLGLYTAFEGLVYPMFRRATHVQGMPCELRECHWIGVGVDFGGATPTALELFGLRASGRGHFYGEFYRVGATLHDIALQLEEWQRLAGRPLDIVACDGSEPVAIASLAAQGFRAVAADKDRDTGIRLVQQRLGPAAGGPGITFGEECQGAIDEFGSYMWASKRDASTKIARLTDEPIDHHGDAMDAVRYVVMASAQRSTPRQVTLPSGRRIWAR